MCSQIRLVTRVQFLTAVLQFQFNIDPIFDLCNHVPPIKPHRRDLLTKQFIPLRLHVIRSNGWMMTDLFSYQPVMISDELVCLPEERVERLLQTIHGGAVPRDLEGCHIGESK